MFDPLTADDTELVDEILALEREVGALHARQARVIAELAKRRLQSWHDDVAEAEAAGVELGRVRGLEGAYDDGSAEVGLALSLSPGTARLRVESAVAWCTQMPATLEALAQGRLDRSRAEHLASLTTYCTPEVRTQVEGEVLALLEDPRIVLTRAKLGHRVRDAIARADSSQAAERAAEAARVRRVWVEPLPDSTSRLCVEGPAAQVQALYTAIEAIAAREDTNSDSDDGRSVGARRFDALVAMAADVLADPDKQLGTLHGQRPHIQVTVAATTLAGADDHPGRLTGYGAIPADAARRLASIGVWRRLLTDPVSGTVLDYGRTTYRPSATLRDLVLAANATCIQPSCGRSSRGAQIDHLTAHGHGGRTSELNLGPQCGPHHRLKTHRPRWLVERLPDGSFAWISPTGHTYVRPPDAIGPVDAAAQPGDAAMEPRALERRAIQPMTPKDKAAPEERTGPEETPAPEPVGTWIIDPWNGLADDPHDALDTHPSDAELASIQRQLDTAHLTA